MPMNHRLLVPRRGGHVFQDADARAYALAVEAADGAKLERLVAKAIDDLVIGLKADSNWTPLGAAVLLAGPRTLAGALVPLVGPAPSNNGPFVSADYARKTGLIGNAATKYLDSNVNIDDYAQDSYHQAVYQTVADTTATDRGVIGAGGGGAGSSQISTNGTNIGFRSRNVAGSTVLSANSVGLLGTSRSGGTQFTQRAAQNSSTAALASQTPFAGNMLVFARESGGTPGLHTGARLAYYSAGTALNSLANLETRLAAYLAAIAAAIP